MEGSGYDPSFHYQHSDYQYQKPTPADDDGLWPGVDLFGGSYRPALLPFEEKPVGYGLALERKRALGGGFMDNVMNFGRRVAGHMKKADYVGRASRALAKADELHGQYQQHKEKIDKGLALARSVAPQKYSGYLDRAHDVVGKVDSHVQRGAHLVHQGQHLVDQHGHKANAAIEAASAMLGGGMIRSGGGRHAGKQKRMGRKERMMLMRLLADHY